MSLTAIGWRHVLPVGALIALLAWETAQPYFPLFRVPVLAVIGCNLGELAIYELMLFAVVQFHHANLALPEPLDRVLRLLIVTPSLHKVHHSIVRAECDSNYSSLFSWWDRAFRTLRLVRDPRRIVFGVEE